MSKLIVADAGPLIALGKLNQLSLLPRLFDRASAPQAVIAECLNDLRLPGALAVQRTLRKKQLHPVANPEGLAPQPFGFDIGERAAILTARRLGAAILVDEKRGRAVARRLGLKVIGTVGILVLARQRGLVAEARPLLTSLKDNGYFISKDLLKAALKLCGE